MKKIDKIYNIIVEKAKKNNGLVLKSELMKEIREKLKMRSISLYLKKLENQGKIFNFNRNALYVKCQNQPNNQNKTTTTTTTS
jgi:hypothetical protein